jgi:hypothetical protein
VEDEALLQYTSPFILFLHLHPLLLRGCVCVCGVVVVEGRVRVRRAPIEIRGAL